MGLILASLMLAGGCGKSETAEAIEQYDPAEVQMLRDQAAASGIELTDELLLSTLQARDDCRTIRAALDSMTAGRTDDEAMQKFKDLPADNRERGQLDQANYFQTLVDSALLGDPSIAKDYHEKNCADVK